MRPPEQLSEEEQIIRSEYTKPAKALRLAGNFRESIALLLNGLEKHPSNLRIICSIGQVFLEQGEYSKATDFFHRAIKINPKSIVAINSLANALNKTGNTKGAARWYHRAYHLNLNDVSAIKGIASTDLRQNKVSKSKQWYLKAHKKHPNCLDIMTGLTKIASEENNQDDLKKWTDMLLSKNPEHRIANFFKALYFYRSGEIESAKNILAILLQSPELYGYLRKKAESLYVKCKNQK